MDNCKNNSKHKGRMTDSLGRPIRNDSNTVTVGKDGNAVLADVHFLDKMAHFDRERIPERVVHAKGAGAFGYFKPYQSMSKYTTADFLQSPGVQTDVFVRFSTVIGGKGSADTVRDPRGFAVKFYTNQGIYDIVGNDLPVFFISDAIKFPDVIHSLKPSPDTNLRDPERFWDFVSLSPESMHMITWLYSDRGTIKDYRHIDGFGVNTFVWVNARSERRYVKYHWKTQQGLETISRQEAEYLAGADPDIAVRLLHEAIEKGDYPKYELCVQLMTEEEAKRQPFNVLDDTKTWSEEEFPLIRVGMMTLNRNPKNFFAEVEQSAFCPANIVPGIEFSNDKMLQGRVFSYHDTQRYRLGANFAQLPINRPKNPPENNQRDGEMTYFFDPDPINYYPNSLAGGKPAPTNSPTPYPTSASGTVEAHPVTPPDYYTQAGERYRGMTEEEKNTLADNIAVELKQCNNEIIKRVLGHFAQADKDFAHRVSKMMHPRR